MSDTECMKTFVYDIPQNNQLIWLERLKKAFCFAIIPLLILIVLCGIGIFVLSQAKSQIDSIDLNFDELNEVFNSEINDTFDKLIEEVESEQNDAFDEFEMNPFHLEKFIHFARIIDNEKSCIDICQLTTSVFPSCHFYYVSKVNGTDFCFIGDFRTNSAENTTSEIASSQEQYRSSYEFSFRYEPKKKFQISKEKYGKFIDF